MTEPLDIVRDDEGVLRCARCGRDVETSVSEIFGHVCGEEPKTDG